MRRLDDRRDRRDAARRLPLPHPDGLSADLPSTARPAPAPSPGTGAAPGRVTAGGGSADIGPGGCVAVFVASGVVALLGFAAFYFIMTYLSVKGAN